ncbi:hypothetical protein DACRYDRAFT_117697 [Dacryopinax primogenitus]|uniref:C2H2-type domain-containing protein n=1 Tax=Dacryopinax primogenitus (strain DJM 731) TaxID=1858805 RepID=M5FV50_DACPD|nr:uncharacterized protein DACRYDRAFT_117697 [Dacryopinax primogenitus]EJU00134.1 hypothetical protein DACRYDRAFT_117697 [Dacryopinax primogenitus]
MDVTIANTLSSTDSFSSSKERKKNGGWAQAPIFLRAKPSKALQHAVAKIDFEEDMAGMSTTPIKSPFLPPPIPGLQATLNGSQSPGVVTTLLSSSRENLQGSGSRKSISTKRTSKELLTYITRQPIKRKVVSARPEELESEEELDTDMEMDVTVVQQTSGHTDEETEVASHGERKADSSSPPRALSPISDLTTPPPSDEEDAYLLATSNSTYASTLKQKATLSATFKSRLAAFTEIPLADLVSAEAPWTHPLMTSWELEKPLPSTKGYLIITKSQSSPATHSNADSTGGGSTKAKTSPWETHEEPKPPKSKSAKAKSKAPAPSEVGHATPVVLRMCGYPNPSNPFETCASFSGGEVESRRHRMKHLYMEWLRQKLGQNDNMVFARFDATFGQCERCGKIFTRGFAYGRHMRERTNCGQLTPAEFTDPNLQHMRFMTELRKAEKWEHFTPTPVPRPMDALVLKSRANNKVAEIVKVIDSYDDRYDIVACKNGTDYEIKFFTPEEDGGTKWYTPMGRPAYMKGSNRHDGAGDGPPSPAREHKVSESSPILQKPRATTNVPRKRGRPRKNPIPKDEDVDMLYNEA